MPVGFFVSDIQPIRLVLPGCYTTNSVNFKCRLYCVNITYDENMDHDGVSALVLRFVLKFLLSISTLLSETTTHVHQEKNVCNCVPLLSVLVLYHTLFKFPLVFFFVSMLPFPAFSLFCCATLFQFVIYVPINLHVYKRCVALFCVLLLLLVGSFSQLHDFVAVGF